MRSHDRKHLLLRTYETYMWLLECTHACLFLGHGISHRICSKCDLCEIGEMCRRWSLWEVNIGDKWDYFCEITANIWELGGVLFFIVGGGVGRGGYCRYLDLCERKYERLGGGYIKDVFAVMGLCHEKES